MKTITIIIAKLSRFLLKLIGRGGSLPGQVSLKINKNILKKLNYSGPVVVVTGTNGKTSTANLIDDMLCEEYDKVISNRKGDNMSYGIATTILSNTSLSGNVKASAIVLEVDELNMPFVMKNVAVTHVVVTNFFRDQLDRAQEMSRIVSTVSKSLEGFNGTLVLNAHDANVMSLSLNSNAKLATYGVKETKDSTKHTSEANDGKFCPKCNSQLIYNFHQYSHIGEFHCESCDFKSPENTMLGEVVSGSEFNVGKEAYIASSSGLYSIYNCMAVICLANELNINAELVRKAFSKADRPIGRNEHFDIGGYTLVLNLIKNPTGANEVLKLIEADTNDIDVIIVCNDNSQDGKDVSWLYDTQFDKLNQDNIKHIYCSGLRAYDMALRLKYAGISPSSITVNTNVEEALSVLKDPRRNIYALTTYTALLPTRKQIERYK